MDRKRYFAPNTTPVLAWVGALAVPAFATGLSAALDSSMSIAGLAMVYLAAVIGAALMLPQRPAAAAALLCVTSLNYFFIPPRHSLSVDSPESWWILACLLGVSVGLGALMATLRRRGGEAETGRARASELHALSEAMASANSLQEMGEAAVSFLGRSTGQPCAIFLREQPAGSTTLLASSERNDFDERPAKWAIDHGRPVGRGCPDWPDLALWCAPFSRHGATGAVELLPGDRVTLAADLNDHRLALVRQVGLSIERERAAAAAAGAEQSAKAEAARNTLLASLSHDLRTPLASLVGSASALRSQGAAMRPAEREKLLANIEDEAQDMALMTDNILQIARLSQPQVQLRQQWESVEDILGAAVARMRRRWPHATIQLKAPAGLPPLRAEASLLAQAVANLVDNAARHGGSPPRVVVQAGKSRDGIFFAVRDYGSGLPDGDPQQLFQRWRGQGESLSGGTGLGLAICQLAAEAHAGRVEAKRCEPGAEFRIDLPAGEPPEVRA